MKLHLISSIRRARYIPFTRPSRWPVVLIAGDPFLPCSLPPSPILRGLLWSDSSSSSYLPLSAAPQSTSSLSFVSSSFFRLSPHLLPSFPQYLYNNVQSLVSISVAHPRIASSRKSSFLDDSGSKMVDDATCPVVCPHVLCNFIRSWSTTEARSTTQRQSYIT